MTQFNEELKNEALAAFRYIVTNLEIALNDRESDEEIEKALQVAQAAIAVLERKEENVG